jgi:hypothetical protein
MENGSNIQHTCHTSVIQNLLFSESQCTSDMEVNMADNAMVLWHVKMNWITVLKTAALSQHGIADDGK